VKNKKVVRVIQLALDMQITVGLKKIVDSIETSVDYNENGTLVTDGAATQIAWFRYNSPETTEAEKEQIRKEMIDYCARDTLAMVDFLKELHKNVH